MHAIDIRKLTKTYGSHTAVDGLELTVEQGEFFALLGLNGAGKTTTIKMLCCLQKPTSGDALLLGDSVVSAPTAVKQKLGVSPQETAVAAKLSVRENLELAARLYGADRRSAAQTAQQMMERFGLAERAKDRAKKLSGGMQRRLSIAMALISQPKILFLDEPTLGLDVRARRELWKLLEDLRGKMTVVLTTHYLEEAEALADRIGIMSRGRLCALGSVQQLREQTGTSTLEDAFLKLTEGEDA